MNHVSLDTQAEAVQQFLLSLTGDPAGTVLELNGQVVACVVPLPAGNGQTVGDWSEARNRRRWELIEKKYRHGPLSPAELVELAQLQEEMLRYRQRVAPLPMEDAQRLHDELLRKAAHAENPS